MHPFWTRLRRAVRTARMSTNDTAIWFSVSYTTAYFWLTHERFGYGPQSLHDHEHKLLLLEKAIRDRALPLHNVPTQARRPIMKRLADEYYGKFSQPHLAE